jgi:ABC-2 type transport system permease protein
VTRRGSRRRRPRWRTARLRGALDAVRLIAALDLRRRIRDRSGLLIALVAPLGLAIVLSQLVGGGAFHARYVVVDLDGGALGAAFRDEVLGRLESAGLADVVDLPTETAAREAVGADADAALIVPQGFSRAIQADRPTSIEIVGARERGLAVEVARAAATSVAAEMAGGQLAVTTVGVLDGAPADAVRAAAIARMATDADPSVALVDRPVGLRRLDPTTFYAAAMAALFVFLSMQESLLGLFQERWRGTLDRILAGPVAPWEVLAGKLVAAFVGGVLAMTALIIATALLIGADWGPVGGVTALSVGLVVASLGIAAAVTSFTSNATAASAAGTALAIALAVLGGTFSPIAPGSEPAATVALLTPNGWFLRGLAELHGTGATAADALPAVAALLAMGAVTLAIGVLRTGRLVRAR